MSERTGSFPFLNIAEDFGLDYGVVVCFAQGIKDAKENTLDPDDPIEVRKAVGFWGMWAWDASRTKLGYGIVFHEFKDAVWLKVQEHVNKSKHVDSVV